MSTSGSDPATANTPEIPGYRVVRRLGEGGMAEIFLAVQLSLQRQVALKVLAFDQAVSDDLAERFEREARTIARLDHPNVVAIHEVGRTRSGLLYYTMPFLANGDLSRRDYGSDPYGAVRVLRSVCEALDYAHGHGIVHRDVKPENILFDKTDRALLADFGIALSREESHRVTHPGRMLGSSGYMSPEQARGQELDGRADVYSLGIVCYEMLTGELPFHGADALAMAIAHMQDPVPKLPPRHRAWNPFLAKALAKSPNERYQSAREMLAGLDEVERRLGPARERAGGAVAAEASRTRGPLLALLGLVLALGAFAYAWRSGAIGSRAGFGASAAPDAATIAAIDALDTSRMDRLLVQGYERLKRGRLVEDDGEDAATPFLELLAAQPDNPEARNALDLLVDTLARQAEGALRSGQGETAAGAYDRAYAVAQRSAIPDYPAWTAFERRYTDALIAALTRASESMQPDAAESLAPALERARTRRADIAAALDRLRSVPTAGEAIRDEGGPAMVQVPARLGSRSVANAFALAVNEVSRGEYAAFAKATGRAAGRCRDSGGPFALLRRRDWRQPGFEQGDREPVVCVEHADAIAYARWLSQRTGQRYRLPTREEWKHAATSVASGGSPCRLGNLLDASTAGNIDLVDRYECTDGTRRTAPVGRFAASSLGLHDLVGNVSEWLADCAARASRGCEQRAVAGSSWRDGAGSPLSGTVGRNAELGAPWIGFRVLRELDNGMSSGAASEAPR